jgi:DNA helicase HerA-like ATPase
MADFRLPNLQQRVAVIGRTGSGKTRFGVWLLSQAAFDKQPFVVIDYKGDDLIAGIDRIKEIGPKEVPKHPGLYVIRPLPNQNNDVEEWLWKIWQKERVGLYVDEGYTLPDKGAFQAILTQGRSKRLPVICLTQRPSWISRFVFSEADFYAVFHLNDHRDRLTVQAFTPKERMNLNGERLAPYHSYWYDVGQDMVAMMQPVPDDAGILQRIEDKLKPKRRSF